MLARASPGWGCPRASRVHSIWSGFGPGSHGEGSHVSGSALFTGRPCRGITPWGLISRDVPCCTRGVLFRFAPPSGGFRFGSPPRRGVSVELLRSTSYNKGWTHTVCSRYGATDLVYPFMGRLIGAPLWGVRLVRPLRGTSFRHPCMGWPFLCAPLWGVLVGAPLWGSRCAPLWDVFPAPLYGAAG